MWHRALIALLVLACCPTGTPAAARTYRIATVAWIGWSPLHVAEVKGFWSQQGVAVDVVDYDDPIIVLEAMRSRKIDLGMDMVGSVVGIYLSGEPVLTIAETNWSHGGDKIIVKAGHDIREVVGQPLGLFLKLPACLYFLDRYLQTQTLGLSNFRIVEIHPDDLTAQFVAGRIPAILNYEPWASAAVSQGDGRVLATSADFEGCIPECLWGYRSHVEELPDEVIEGILVGWLRAVQWIRQPRNQAAYFDILNTATFANFPAYSAAELNAMRQYVRIHSREALFGRNRSGGGLTQYLMRLKTFLKKNHMLERDYEPEDLFDNQWIMDALESENRKIEKGILRSEN